MKKKLNYKNIIESCIFHKFNLKLEVKDNLPKGFFNSGIEGDTEFSQLNKFFTNNTIFNLIYSETEAVCTLKDENISALKRDKMNLDFLDAFNTHRYEIFENVFKKCWEIIMDYQKIDEETKHLALSILSRIGSVEEAPLEEDLKGIDLYVTVKGRKYSVQVKSSKDMVKGVDEITVGKSGDYKKLKDADYFIFFKRVYNDVKKRNEYTESCLMPTEKLSVIGNRIIYSECKDLVKIFTQSQMEADRIAYEKNKDYNDYGKPLFD